MQTIETNRLVLRDFRLSDLNDFFDYAKSAKVGPMAGWKPHESLDESEKILESFIKSDDVWAIELKESNKLIGSIGLHVDSKRSNPNTRMLGYVLGEDYWGKGIMLEAVRALLNYGFNELSLDLISVYHFPFNTQSASVIKNAGFKYEGTLRQSTMHFEGRCLDSVLYSLTKEEYNAI